jgi:hypothetical protein
MTSLVHPIIRGVPAIAYSFTKLTFISKCCMLNSPIFSLQASQTGMHQTAGK